MSTYINSPNGTGTDPQIATFSMWFKITKPEATELYLFSGGDGATNNSWLRFQGGTGQLYFRNRTSSSNDCVIQTSAKYKDVNGWYHVVLKLNSTLSTAADRATMYVNGQEITSFSSSLDMTQNNLFHMFGYTITHIGKRVNDGTTGNVGGFLASHVHFCDGYAYDASYFGSTDATTGEWKINTNPNVTYGTRGFFILKDGNSVTDQSGNGNNFTVAGGTLTNTEDNPSNVFATLNPLCIRTQIIGSPTFSYTNGNNTHSNTDPSYSTYNVSTLGMQGSGKYYCEFKVNALGSPSNSESFGISNLNNFSNYPFGSSSGYSYSKDGSGTPSGSGFPTYTTNDIIGIAFDSGNGNLWFSKNGTWINNATISEIGSGDNTNAVFTGISTSETWHFSGATYDGGTFSSNFGNGYFGTTAVASAGTNTSGIGIFEYDVPTGYTALSTKGLNL